MSKVTPTGNARDQKTEQSSPAKKQPESVPSNGRNRLDSDPIYGDAKEDDGAEREEG